MKWFLAIYDYVWDRWHYGFAWKKNEYPTPSICNACQFGYKCSDPNCKNTLINPYQERK